MGKSTIRVEFKYDGVSMAKGAAVKCSWTTRRSLTAASTRQSSSSLSAEETFDTGSPVSDQYASPFQFARSLTKIEVDIARTNFCQLDQDRISEALRAAADAEE